MTFSDKATKYFCNLKSPDLKVDGVSLINPYQNEDVKEAIKSFFNKFYYDNNKRLFIIGINPGRFGGGLTGIAFSDPVALREHCKIENHLGSRKELSSKFIYTVIEIFGGPKKFFGKVFLTALYPLAIIKNGKNYNYYDDKLMAEKIRSAIIKNIKTQIDFGAKRDFAILLGKKNADYFKRINDEHGFFQNFFVLEHPRYIMQYRLKHLDSYINKYISAISV